MKNRLLVLTALVWLSALAEVIMRDRYHDMLAQVDNFAWLAAFPILVAGDLLVTAVLRRFGWREAGGPRADLPVRHFVLALGLWLWMVPGNGPKLAHFVEALAASAGAWGLLWFCDHRWGAGLRRWGASRGPVALTVAAIAFVSAPPIVLAARSHQVSWPDARHVAKERPAPGGASAGNGQVLVLILDELSDKSAEPVARALADEGFVVARRALMPIGDATAKVIPAMWLRRPFPQARPCGVAAICSGLDLLDFSNVDVGWPDVDVVGFYHPYCAMRGLRWCRRVSPPSAFGDAQRVTCALSRRLLLPPAEICQRARNTPWLDLVARAESAYWDAPFWERKGLLFAHLPIPHPPGPDPEATLVDHYASGVAHAAALVARSARQLKQVRDAAATVPTWIVITSDHPLRVREWCTNGAYSPRRCAGADTLADDAVPLIVGAFGEGAAAADLSPYRSNQQLFDLVTALRLPADKGPR
jgi:hypothetical protein